MGDRVHQVALRSANRKRAIDHGKVEGGGGGGTNLPN